MIEGKEEMQVLGKDGQIEFASKENAGKPEKKNKSGESGEQRKERKER